MAKLKIEVDKDNNKLILGGLALYQNNDDVHFVKILGLYKDKVEVFDIVDSNIDILSDDILIPAKLTIDGLDVSKESYRIFVSNLDNDFKYIIKTYTTKPKPEETVIVSDLKLLNSSLFNSLVSRDVTIIKYNKEHHNYTCLTSGGIEIWLRRTQFTRKENNTIDIATLTTINE